MNEMLKELLAGPVVKRVKATNVVTPADNPLKMTANEKKEYKRIYPSAALGVRALLTKRGCTLGEIVAFSKDVYGGDEKKATSRTKGLIGDKTSKMAARYKLECVNGVYKINV